MVRAYDAHWLATNATAAAWGQALTVQSGVADVEAALAAGDHETLLEATWLTLVRIGFCLLLLDGYTGTSSELDVLDALVAEDHPLVDDLHDHQVGNEVSEVQVDAALAVLRRWDTALTEALPFQIPAIRTPRGFFPSVRMASQFEKLRAALGLPPFEWGHWNV